MQIEKKNQLKVFIYCAFIAELAERSPIIIQNSSNPSSRKNLDVRPYDRTTVRPYDRTTVRPHDRTIVQGPTFNMRGERDS